MALETLGGGKEYGIRGKPTCYEGHAVLVITEISSANTRKIV